VVDHTATARIERLVRWLERFKSCFGHRAQLMALRTYVQGVFSDSERKSMQAMLARVTEPIAYQAFQHFITHAPWDADRVWRRLRAAIPERRGVLILDGTSFPKQGPASVGAARQYCGALGKIANCQVATTVALWTGVRAWFLGATLYLPDGWLTTEQRQRARIPAAVDFQEKWRHAVRLLRQVRAAGFTITAVLGDAEFGDVTVLRATLHRLALPYALGISSTLTVFTRPPQLVTPPPSNGRGRLRTARRVRATDRPLPVREVARDLPRSAWRWISWRNGEQPKRRARFAALRVNPRARLARRTAAPRGLAPVRTGSRHPDADQVLPGASAARYITASSRGAGAPTLGDRTAVSGTQERTRARSLRRPHVSGMAAPRRADRGRPCVHPTRADAPGRRRPDIPGCTRVVQEIFTALLFAQKPRYKHWMEQAKRELQLRI
jgi:SRSO17 transposase